MNDETTRELEELADDERVPSHCRFRASVLLLFDRYDPFNPANDLTPDAFFGILQREIRVMQEQYVEAAFDMQAALGRGKDIDAAEDEHDAGRPRKSR